MAKHIITIDGPITPWGYSQQWLKQMLQGHEKDEVILNMSSLGGYVHHAFNMHDQIKNHGNVTVNYIGFNASSATVIGSAAKKRRISKNSLYLVHKVMTWIDVFGLLNDDDIDEIIQKLTKEKNESAKMTLIIAKIYHKTTSKSIRELLELMKEDTWIDADEALEWGFVDEIFEPEQNSVNILEDTNKVAMIMANGFPSPATGNRQPTIGNQQPLPGNQQPATDDLINRIITGISNIFHNNNNKTMQTLEFINKALEVDKLEADEKGNIILPEEQAKALDQLLQQNQTNTEKLQGDLDAEKNTKKELESQLASKEEERKNAVTEKENVTGEKDAAEKNLNEVVTGLNEIHPDVEKAENNKDKVQAVKTIIAEKPGDKPVGNQSTGDDKDSPDSVNWDAMDKLPHNKEADNA